MSRAHPGRHAGNTIASRMKSLEDRVQALDVGLQEVHPEYANRILTRMHEVEKVTRGHANEVLRIIQKQKDDFNDVFAECKKIVGEAAMDADRACQRLDAAAQRHQSDGACLRQELGILKCMIDEQSQQCTIDLKNMESLVLQASNSLEAQESLDAKTRHQLNRLTEMTKKLDELAEQVCTKDFRTEQAHILRAAKHSSMPINKLIHRAQSLAQSREHSLDEDRRTLRAPRSRSYSRGRQGSLFDAVESASVARRNAQHTESVLNALLDGGNEVSSTNSGVEEQVWRMRT